ncbi:Uncharacterised protein [Burkholderia multivorans]|nr:Uncharacterised protein [Burkholderia multivorans]
MSTDASAAETGADAAAQAPSADAVAHDVRDAQEANDANTTDATSANAATPPATEAETEADAATERGTAVVPVAEAAPNAAPAPADKSTLHVSRPTQNELTLTINGESMTLHPEQLGQLIEELAHARASMQPEPPNGIPPGWRFVSTKNPMMAVQKQSNGDRLLVMRHTGYGWVPFTFSPDVVIQMYMLLTQR